VGSTSHLQTNILQTIRAHASTINLYIIPQVAKRASRKRAEKDKLFMTKCTCKVFERKLMRMKGTCVNYIYMKILSICILILLYLKSYF
jgi:hypothetical protein